MPIFECLDHTTFDGSPMIDWMAVPVAPGASVNPAIDTFTDSASLLTVTIEPLSATQSLSLSVCGPSPGRRCNMESGTGLLLAQNKTGAPICLRFSGDGVRSVGAFMMSPVPRGTPFTPQLWVEVNGGGTPINVRGLQGVTGDIWMKPGDSVAPFVGAQATDGDRITRVKFDAIHPTDLSFNPLGIGYLYFIV